MTDYRKILMLRSMGCSQREMERNKIASRETSKAVFETADRLGICWPLDDDISPVAPVGAANRYLWRTCDCEYR